MSDRNQDSRSVDEMAIVRYSDGAQFVRVSPVCLERVGFTNDELSARSLLDWTHVDDRPGLQAALDAGEGLVCARHACKDGDWVMLRWRFKADGSGIAALGRLDGASPGRARAEVRVPLVMGANISETLARMALIVESKNPGMMCSVLLVDATGERVAVGAGPSLPKEYNDAVEGLQLGPAVGSCGTAAYWNTRVIVENIATDPLWRDLREAAAIAGVAACWSQPITSTGGEVLGAMALYDTVPSSPSERQLDGLEIAAQMVGLAIERDRLEEQLRNSAKLEALGVLAGGIAHDFNNMLAAILGNADLALDAVTQSSAAAPMLQEIKAASVRASELCGQMLAYAGRGAMNTELVDCSSMVKDTGSLLRVALAKKAELLYELSDSACCVQGDRIQLRQVVMNLITNASEAIGNNEGTIRIGTELSFLDRNQLDAIGMGTRSEPGEYVHIWVSDTGEGISAETRPRIFDPFFTTKESGRGLGLAAVQGVIMRHGGVITHEAGRNGGTLFSIYLPSSSEVIAGSASATEKPTQTEAATILVVDDEPAVRDVLIRMVRLGGYEVLSAEDGLEAIEVFRRESENIDCVLLDLSMPKLDGDEVFRELQSIRSDVRVVLSSGFAEEQVLERFRDAGLAGLIQKPADLNRLLATLEMALKSGF